MFGPIGGGLSNGSNSPISPSATMGDTKSGSDANSSFRSGSINLGGGGISNTTLIIGAAAALGVLYMLKK